MTRIFGSNHKLGFFYNKTRYDSNPGPAGRAGLLLEPLLESDQVSDYGASLYRLSYDWTISPHMFNHMAVGGNQFYKNSYSPNSGGNWKSKVCIPNAVDCNVNFPNLSFTEFTGWGSTAYNGTEQPAWSLKDDLSYIHGAHTLKFGYAFESQRANGFGQQNIAGQASFSFLETAVPGATSFTSGSSFASFLLGAADSGATETIRYLPQTFDYHGFYAQDDWHFNKKLTLTMGLRYEFTRPPVAGGNQYTDFSPTTPNPAVNNYPGALIFAGTGTGRTGQSSLIPGWYGAWGPRLGLAYALNSKTTIRAGAARSFSRVTVVASSSHYAGFIGQYASLLHQSKASRPPSIGIAAHCRLIRCPRRSTHPLPTTATWITGKATTPPVPPKTTTGPSRFNANSLRTPSLKPITTAWWATTYKAAL